MTIREALEDLLRLRAKEARVDARWADTPEKRQAAEFVARHCDRLSQRVKPPTVDLADYELIGK